MRTKVAFFLILGVSLVFGLLFARQLILSKDLPRSQFQQKKLRILAYSTFMSSTGPGEILVGEFKKRHGCEVNIQTVGDAGMLLERLRLSEGRSQFDVVIGLDQNLLTAAREKAKWRPIAITREGWVKNLTETPQDPNFVPFDWSQMTFIYRKGAVNPPTSMQDLLNSRFQNKLALQEPRASSPGMQFLGWVRAVVGPDLDGYLSRLQPNVASVSPSWAFSYGLFKKEQADLVFSYITSLAFHWGFEKDRSYQAAQFTEGHPLQVEYAAVPETCKECELGEAFVRELLLPESQKVIMERNFMFPVLAGVADQSIFAELPKLPTMKDPTSAEKTPSEKDLSAWEKVFKH